MTGTLKGFWQGGPRHGVATSVFLVLVLLAVCAVIFGQNARALWLGSQELKNLQQQQIIYQDAVRDLTLGSVALTDRVRRFVSTGRLSSLEDYFREADVERRRENSLKAISQLPRRANWEEAIRSAIGRSVDLMQVEYRAMKLAARYWKIPEEKLPRQIRAVVLSAAEEALTGADLRAKMDELVFGEAYHNMRMSVVEKSGIVLDKAFKYGGVRMTRLLEVQENRYYALLCALGGLAILMVLLLVLALLGARQRRLMRESVLIEKNKRLESDRQTRTLQGLALFRSQIVEFMITHQGYEEIRDFICERTRDVTGCNHLMFYTSEGSHLDWLDPEAMPCCREHTARITRGATFLDALVKDDTLIVRDVHATPELDVDANCPAQSFVQCQFHRPGGWWRLFVDFTKERRIDLDEVARTLRVSLELLSIAYDREQQAKTIADQLRRAEEMNAQLVEERDRVVEAEKTKSAFFSSVSHDIRTPLNAVIGFSELLQDDGMPREEQKRDLAMIETSGKMLLHLVNDLLDLSKLEAGKMDLQLEPTNGNKLVEEILPVFRPMAEQKRQTLEADASKVPTLLLDPYRLRQIVFNLLGNAVKYAGPCTVRVSVAYEPCGGRGATALPDAGVVGSAPRADRGVFTLVVEDDGNGIDPKDVPRLMQPYAQVHSEDRKVGTGLGLPICKQLAERMGGTFTLDAALGKGCTFTLTIPNVAKVESSKLKVEKSGDAQPSTFNVQPSTRILVVDDAMVNRVMLTSMLRSLGVKKIVEAENGKLALAVLEKDPAFDFVLTDMWMPEMDGAALVQAIRADAKFAALKVCLVTASAEARDTYKAQGFDDLLMKPITRDALRELLVQS